MPAAYFTSLDADRYLPTDAAEGAWSSAELHVAPVCGLITHHLLTRAGSALVSGGRISRITFDILGQIPRQEITLASKVIRPGRTIELVESTASIGGRAVVTARAWLLADGDTSAVAGHDLAPLPAPGALSNSRLSTSWPGGFIASVRGTEVGPTAPGRGRTWVTTDTPLLADTEISPVAAYIGLVDTANGSAVRRPPTELMFPNVDLTVHFFRTPVGLPVGMDTRVSFGPTGQGLTSTTLHDADGPVGSAQQSLTVRPLQR